VGERKGGSVRAWLTGVVSGIIEDDKNDSKKVNSGRFIIKDHLLLYKRSYISHYVFTYIRKRNKR
jgi:hypothetical protein